MQTPVLSAVKLNKFSSGENIPFNIEAISPADKGKQDSGNDTGSSGSGKHTIILMDTMTLNKMLRGCKPMVMFSWFKQ